MPYPTGTANLGFTGHIYKSTLACWITSKPGIVIFSCNFLFLIWQHTVASGNHY